VKNTKIKAFFVIYGIFCDISAKQRDEKLAKNSVLSNWYLMH